MLQLLLDGHEVLRSILTETPRRSAPGHPRTRCGQRRRSAVPGGGTDFDRSRIRRQPSRDSARKVMDEIDPPAGEMVRAVWFAGGSNGTGGRQLLLLTIHHLVVDVVSWHILVSDIKEAWRSVQAGVAPKALPEFTSYRRWSQLMWERAGRTGGFGPARLLECAGPWFRSRAGYAACGSDSRHLVPVAGHHGVHPGRGHRAPAGRAHSRRPDARNLVVRRDDRHRELASCSQPGSVVGRAHHTG